jgi:SAM-dependent methyltransferase
MLAAESNLVAGSAGETFRIAAPDQDHLADKFCPDGLPTAARLSLRLKRIAKQVANHPTLYAIFKLPQMLSQDRAAKSLVERYAPAVFVSDGNALLSTTARAANILRAASVSETAAAPEPDAEDLRAVFSYVLENVALPEESRQKLPSLRIATLIYKLNNLLRLRAVWLPDVVIFLDLSPQLALSRIRSRGKKIDAHENLADLTQARGMYLKTLKAFQKYRSSEVTHCIDVNDLTLGETLRAVRDVLRPHLISGGLLERNSILPLGTTDLAETTIQRKTVNHRYLFRYLLAKWFTGAWREPTFFFSKLGRLFLKEGYSAGVMRAIYDQDDNKYGLLDRIFLEYSLHRAVYDRLQILVKKIKTVLEEQLAEGREIRIFTAPSGFAYDLFRPLEQIARADEEAMKRIHVTAADLDPYGVLQEEVTARANRLGIQITFLQCDITDEGVRCNLEQSAPFDLALFVGLSSWLPKPDTLVHLAWLRENLRPDGRLVTDCFTPEAYALSGRYIGYKASYYTPEVYKAMLDYCGFEGLKAELESGRDGINHVLVASPQVMEESTNVTERQATVPITIHS